MICQGYHKRQNSYPLSTLTLLGNFLANHNNSILWRAAIEEIIEKREILERCGIRVAAVGNGTPEMAKEFLNDYPKFPGRLFVDPNKKLFNAMHCKFGIKYALNEEVLESVRNACEKGYKQKGIQGDPLQLGGTFIISPVKGMIYRRLENYIGSATDLPTLIPFIEEYSKNNPEITWLTRDVDDTLATSKLNREFQFNYYQYHFLTQLHWLYVLPRSEQNSPLIFAVMDLKQGDKKCLAFHAKGKTKFYWPCYLSEQEMFDHATRRIFGKHIEGFIKVIRNAALVDVLCILEDTINNHYLTEATGTLDNAINESTDVMLRHSSSNNGYSAKVAACN
jgi:hypothetical protein